MSGRRPYVVANWKMHKTIAESEEFLSGLLEDDDSFGDVDVVVCPPFTALAAAVARCASSSIQVAAQNMHQEPEGAFTGEVAARMLAEVGVDAVVLGHSERRAMFAETDEALAQKVPAALEAGLVPILCVGETEPERDSGDTEAVLLRQVSTGLSAVVDAQLAEIVIAYEPVWAIGTGRTATPEQAEEAIASIRRTVAGRDAGAAEKTRILYGGSVKPDNAAGLLSRAGIDGALVGGASLDPVAFSEIVAAASVRPER